MPETDPPRPMALNIDQLGSIQLCGPTLKLSFLTKIPVDGSGLSKNQGANRWRRGREHTKPDFGYEGVAMRDD